MLNSREVWGYLTLHDVTTTGFTPLLKILFGFPHSESRLLLFGGLVNWDTWWKGTGQFDIQTVVCVTCWVRMAAYCCDMCACCSEHFACCGRSAACTSLLSRSSSLLWVLRSVVGWLVCYRRFGRVYGCQLQGSRCPPRYW